MEEEKINDSSVELSDEDLSNTIGGLVETVGGLNLSDPTASRSGYKRIGTTDEEQAVAVKKILENLPVALQRYVINQ